MQSRSALEDLSEKTSGAGSLIIYMLTKFAQKMGRDRIKVVSLDEHSGKFYEKVGFDNDYKSIYIMDSPKYSQLPSKIK